MTDQSMVFTVVLPDEVRKMLRENYFVDSLLEAPGDPPAAPQPVGGGADPTGGMDMGSGMDMGGDMGGGMGMDAGMGGGGMGMDMGMGGGMGGMGMGEEDQKELEPTPTNIGRLYEIKKIHNHLKAIQGYLTRSTDPRLNNLKKLADDAIEIFQMVLDNLTIYKDKLDDIIVTYFKFVKRLADVVEEYYRREENKRGDKTSLKDYIKKKTEKEEE